MTVLIAALYLPYTVSFDVLRRHIPEKKSTSQWQVPSPPLRQSSQDGSRTTIPSMMGVLSALHQPSPPITPPMSVETVDFFSQRLPVDIDAARKKLTQPQSTAATPPQSGIVPPRRPAVPTGTSIRSRRRSGVSDIVKFTSAPWSIEPTTQGNGGLRNAVTAVVGSGDLKEKKWIGTLGMPTDSLTERKEEISRSFRELDCEIVYVPDSDMDGHYIQYCKQILWPTFHYQIPDNPKNKAYEDHSWGNYVAVNRAFADLMVEQFVEGDVIWVHDYHLLLVPAMVRERLPHATVGFFMHVAFPSSEVFRCLPVRKELLEGMLGANVIGFQTADYARHFLQTCNRLLGVEADAEGIYLEDRFVQVVNDPIGIDPEYLRQRLCSVEVQEWIRLLKGRYEGKRVLVARDKLDHIRGIRHKFLAFETFLKKHPEMKDVVLIQVALSTTEQNELGSSVSDLVTRINSNHTLGHQPLIFLHQDISFAQYLALLTIADALVVTSLREGMNLTSHEFVYCQQEHWGSLVLSEFTGTAPLFDPSAISVNPWDSQSTAAAIYKALTMPMDERKERWKHMYEDVTRHTSLQWWNFFLQTLREHSQHEEQRERHLIPRLSVDKISDAYKSASRRIFIIDYEGTLANWGSANSIIQTSPQRVIDVLTDLVSDSRNTVYVMSGITPNEMERLFRRVPMLGFIAESGCFIRYYGEPNFTSLVDEADNKWKETVAPILEYYAERTTGTRIEEKNCSFTFHYEAAEDQAHAAWQAGECANHVNDACASLRVHAVPLESALLVEHLDYTKVRAVRRIFEHEEWDFVFVAGNERSDEEVFRLALEISGEAVRVSVGERMFDCAQYMVQGPTGEFLSFRRS